MSLHWWIGLGLAVLLFAVLWLVVRAKQLLQIEQKEI